MIRRTATSRSPTSIGARLAPRCRSATTDVFGVLLFALCRSESACTRRGGGGLGVDREVGGGGLAQGQDAADAEQAAGGDDDRDQRACRRPRRGPRRRSSGRDAARRARRSGSRARRRCSGCGWRTARCRARRAARTTRRARCPGRRRRRGRAAAWTRCRSSGRAGTPRSPSRRRRRARPVAARARSDSAENPMIPTTATTEDRVSALSTVGRGKPACTAYEMTNVVRVACATNAPKPTPTDSGEVARVVAQDLEQRRPGGLLRGRLGEHGRLGDPGAHEQADGQQHDAQQERDPPAPGEELLLAGQRRRTRPAPGSRAPRRWAHRRW